MTLFEIVELYNEAFKESQECYGDHYIIHRSVTPHKTFGAYKEFKITLYNHIKGENIPVWEIKESYKASSQEEIKSWWIVMEEKAVKQLIKWMKGWN